MTLCGALVVENYHGSREIGALDDVAREEQTLIEGHQIIVVGGGKLRAGEEGPD